MTVRRATILSILNKNRLLEIAQLFDIEVEKRILKKDLLSILSRTRKLYTEELIAELKVAELREACNSAGLNDRGRTKAELNTRLLNSSPKKTSKSKNQEKRPHPKHNEEQTNKTNDRQNSGPLLTHRSTREKTEQLISKEAKPKKRVTHKSRKNPLIPCSVCGTVVSEKGHDKHVERVHGKEYLADIQSNIQIPGRCEWCGITTDDLSLHYNSCDIVIGYITKAEENAAIARTKLAKRKKLRKHKKKMDKNERCPICGKKTLNLSKHTCGTSSDIFSRRMVVSGGLPGLGKRR